MPALDRNAKTACDNCGTLVSKQNLAKHKKKCSVGTLYCSQCPNFSTKSQNDSNYHIAKKHGTSNPKTTHICKVCKEEFAGFYALRQHKSKMHGLNLKKDDSSPLVDDIDDESLKEELRACEHFLVDSEFERGRHKVFNYAVETLNTEIVNDKLDNFFYNLKCAAKVNLAFGFILKNLEDGRYRYFYAHENNTLLDRSQLVCTKDDLTKLKNIVNQTDVIESCTAERMNTKWRFYKLTNLTVFAALLKDIPMGCRDAVLPDPLLKNHTVNCLTFEQNTRQPYNDNLFLFRALALHLHGNEKLEEETNKLFNCYLEKKGGIEPATFQGVCVDDIPLVEDLIQVNIFLYDIDIVDGSIVGELARRSVQKYCNTVRLLRYNNHICYVSNINALFKAYRCSTCNQFFNKTGNLERHLVTCKDRIKHVYPRNVYQLRETLFDKLDFFSIPYTKEQQLFKNLAVFDFESICVREEQFKDTETTQWIGKHVPISVSISSNLIETPLFLCNSNPQDLVESFVVALESLAAQSKAQMKLQFLDIETSIKSRLNAMFAVLNERRGPRETVLEFEDECLEVEEKDVSTQFLQMQKNQLLDLQEHLERYCNVLPVFGFNSSKYDNNLIKRYLLPLLVNERELEPTVIKKANQFVSFKFGDVQLLDILNFLGGATSLDSFLKAYKTSETKGYFPYEWFDCPEKLNDTQLPPYEPFFNKLRISNPLESDYTEYEKLLKSGSSPESALSKMRLSQPPLTGKQNYEYLVNIWESEKMTTFKDFLRWYNNKDVVPTLEAMQKMIAFYHHKGIDMLKLGCTLPNLANICLHKSTNAKFYPFTENDKDLLEKIRDDMVGGPSIVFTRKTVVNETLIRDSANVCKSIVGIDASQLYPFSMCQEIPTGLYTRWDLDPESGRFRPRQNKTRSFENMVMSYYQRIRPDCKIVSFYTTGTQKKIDCFSVDGFCEHCNTVFEAMGCYYHYCPCQEARPSLTEEEIQRGTKKREMDELRRHYLMEKGYTVMEMYECEWWQLYKTNVVVKQQLRQSFPYKIPLSEERLLERIKNGSLFGYVQCDIEVPPELREQFANFPPIFKNINVGRDDIGSFMKNYAEQEGLLSQPRRMLISSYSLENGTLITPLLLFYLSLGLVCKKIYRFVQYTPKKCFNKFVQSAVDARREGDENPNSSVVAETMKLLANSSYGYQIMDRSRHTVTKYLCEEKVHAAINNKMFKRLNIIDEKLYEVELAKSEIEHREPIIVGFFILQYAKLRMLELYYNFFVKYCDINKFEELEMDTDSLYLALAEEELYDCIRPDKKREWTDFRSSDCADDFKANATTNFFPRTCCTKHKKHDKREPGLFKEEFRCTEMLCLCSKTYCCYDSQSHKFKFSSKGLNKRTLESSGDGPMSKYRKVLEETLNVTSTNRGFRVIDHNVGTYEQTKKGLSYFYPKRIVQEDGIHTRPLTI